MSVHSAGKVSAGYAVADRDGDVGYPVVDLPPAADTPEAAVRCLVAALVRAGRLPEAGAAGAIRQVWQRERLGSTAIGRGVAIPHAQSGDVAGPVGAVGRCARPLDWPGAADGGPVAVVCLVLLPTGPAGQLFRELERVARQLRGPHPRPPR